jgi:hypothetical protein
MQYRFGTADSVELTLPAEKSGSLAAFRGGIVDSGTGNGYAAMGYLRIYSGRFAYVVYQGAAHYGDLPGGLIVERDGVVVSNQYCAESGGAGTSLLSYDFWDRSGIEKDKRAVDIPARP